MSRFEQFIKERQYLQNVSPATLEWHRSSLKWLTTENPTEDDLKALVIRMRERGLNPGGCNNRIRSVNAYLKWAGSPHRLKKLKEPQLVMPTFSAPQVTKLLSWKPKGFGQRRLHLLVLILLDTGCRISEALSLHVSDIDLNNLSMCRVGYATSASSYYQGAFNRAAWFLNSKRLSNEFIAADDKKQTQQPTSSRERK